MKKHKRNVIIKINPLRGFEPPLLEPAPSSLPLTYRGRFAVAQSTRTFNGCALSLPYLFVYCMEVLLVKSADWVLYPFASLLRVGSLMRLREGITPRGFSYSSQGRYRKGLATECLSFPLSLSLL